MKTMIEVPPELLAALAVLCLALASYLLATHDRISLHPSTTMKATALILAATAALLTSCTNPAGSTAAAPTLPQIPKPVVDEAVKIGTAAAIGYLQAGKAGAAAAASGQAITDLQAYQASRATTAAKNPVQVQP